MLSFNPYLLNGVQVRTFCRTLPIIDTVLVKELLNVPTRMSRIIALVEAVTFRVTLMVWRVVSNCSSPLILILKAGIGELLHSQTKVSDHQAAAYVSLD